MLNRTDPFLNNRKADLPTPLLSGYSCLSSKGGRRGNVYFGHSLDDDSKGTKCPLLSER